MIEVVDVEDTRLAPYRQLRHSNLTGASGLFIAEGPTVVERLLQSDYRVQSVLVDDKHVHRFESLIPSDVPGYVVPHAQVASLVGFNFHRGVLACGIRQPLVDCQLACDRPLDDDETMAMIIGVQDPENVGGILRCCAGLGISRVAIGPNTADPLSRRVLRVSMGTALSLTLIRSRDCIADLTWLSQQRNVQTLATSLAPQAEQLEQATRNGPVMIVLGNEANGLPDDVQRASNRLIRIDMKLGTDSLNVCMAAGIILHYFCRLSQRVCKHVENT